MEKEYHIRWSRLTPDRVAPDISAALKKGEEALRAIANRPLEEATFANTLLAMEEAVETVAEPWGKAGHLISVCDSMPLREAYHEMLPAVSVFFTRISLDAGLWERVKRVADGPEAARLSSVQRRFLEETVKDFRQNGADLPPEKKTRLEKLQKDLASLTQQYSENVLDSTNAWELVIDDESKLAGLPRRAREAARLEALRKGLGTEEDPRWRFTLHMPSQEPFMTYLEDDGLRRRMWEGAVSIGGAGEWDNRALIRKILELRREKAALLGRKHFADLVLERRMARDGQAALDFVDNLFRLSEAPFARECGELEAFKARETGQPVYPLEPWEIAFRAERQRRALYDFDEEALRPYFPIGRVIDGLFEIVQRIFDLRIEERPVVYREPGGVSRDSADGAVEVWHPEVKYYDLRDGECRHLGSFYADWHPRGEKRGGAWMNYLITGANGPNGRSPHLGLICGNLTPSSGQTPALLTHREVETVFHEFGHLLHHLLGEVEIKSLNGVNVAWDFVELPSQIMENWCWERESLDLFARHYQTGETIPDELFAKMISARNYRSAAAMMRQLAFGKLDLDLHTRPGLPEDLEEEARRITGPFQIPTRTASPSVIGRFTHVFGSPTGYAAGYYSYKWAEVLDADAFTRFQKEGIFNPKVGRAFVEAILSRGNAEEPEVLFRQFMGRDPDPGALLRRCGLASPG